MGAFRKKAVREHCMLVDALRAVGQLSVALLCCCDVGLTAGHVWWGEAAV